MPETKIQVYIDTGAVYEYPVEAETDEALNAKVREHHHEIATDGYRSVTGNALTTWPPHRIDKIKSEAGMITNYEDSVRGT